MRWGIHQLFGLCIVVDSSTLSSLYHRYLPYAFLELWPFFLHFVSLRYVNCACNNEEQNLVAFQYRGRILYRCCRPIDPEQELLVWYEEEYAKELSPVFDCLWNKKCPMNGKICLYKPFQLYCFVLQRIPNSLSINKYIVSLK